MKEFSKYMPYKESYASEELYTSEESYWRSSFRLFCKNKIGIISVMILCIIVLFCLFGEYIRPFGVQEQLTSQKNLHPSSTHWFGTDQLGRDIFVRVCHGGRISIQIGLIASAIVSVIGVIYGSISGYIGGKTDIVMMRIVEVFKGVPHLVIVIILSILLNVKGILPLVLALTISGWVNTAQIIRGQVKQLKNQEFILAAQCLGISDYKIIMKHIIPNMMGMIIVALTLDIPGYIFEEAFLSFIGLGLKNPSISWGTLISLAQPNLVHYPYQILFPAVAISITMIAFNIVGNVLKESFDPKQRS